MRESNVVQVPKQRDIPMQPGDLVVNAQLLHGLYLQPAFKAKIFREALGHAEDNLFA